MNAFEVAQMYETFASGGYLIPLRSIREITTQDGTVISRFDLKAVKAIEPGPHYLIVSTMQEIPRRGTATALKEKISPSLNIAGKTGTTDSYRDSWFAGFSGNLLSVVWVGNDQNKITRLTGGTGAMRVWMDIMKNLPNEPLELKKTRRHRHPHGGQIQRRARRTGLRRTRGRIRLHRRLRADPLPKLRRTQTRRARRRRRRRHRRL